MLYLCIKLLLQDCEVCKKCNNSAIIAGGVISCLFPTQFNVISVQSFTWPLMYRCFAMCIIDRYKIKERDQTFLSGQLGTRGA